MKLKICFLGMLCTFFGVIAKGNNINISDKGLQIGDVVPDLMLENVLNYSSTSVNLSDFKGKLIVLDFWATSCGSCIEAIPNLEAVQHEFGDQIRVLTVSNEKTERVTTFLKNNPTGKKMSLPVVTADVRLNALFPHKIISHEVWINEDGRVLAITGPEYVNAKNIRLALAGNLHLPVKRDILAFDYSKPLWGAAQRPLYYSAVCGFKAGLAPRFGSTVDSATAKIRTYMVNFPLLQMYLMSVGHLLYFPKTMIDVRLADSSRVYVPAGVYKEEWKERNNWCYESMLPAAISQSQRMDAMRLDLNRFFNLNGRLEKRQAKCLSLERTNTGKIPVSNGGPSKNSLHGTGTFKELVNASLENLIWELNDIPEGLPVVDNTGIKGNVDMRLQLHSFADIQSVNEALLPFGLTFTEKTQEVEFFVLTDALN